MKSGLKSNHLCVLVSWWFSFSRLRFWRRQTLLALPAAWPPRSAERLRLSVPLNKKTKNILLFVFRSRGLRPGLHSAAPSGAACRFLRSAFISPLGTCHSSLVFCLLLTASTACPAFCLLSLLTACGYHVAGRGDRLPADVKTIAVPIFVNETTRFRIEQRLAAAVTREFIERTKFRITPDSSQADAVLKGSVKDARTGVVTFDLKTGRATTLQIQVTTNIELVDLHTKKVLFSNPNYVFREEYQVSQTTPELFEEDQPALDRLSRDLARTLVTEILENF